MVITSRPTSNDNAAEMMHMHKHKQGVRRSSLIETATAAGATRKVHAPLPLRPPPPLLRLHNATANNVVAVIGTGTPPLAVSPGQASRRLRKSNQQTQVQAASQLQQKQQQQYTPPIISWGGKQRAQTVVMTIDSASASAAAAETGFGGGGSRMRGADEDEPLPWPPSMSPLQLQPRPLHQHQLHLPNDSFGDEDFGILAGCIENLDSMGSADNNSDIFNDSIRQGENSGTASSHTTASVTVDDRHHSSCLSSETEKVMAAAQAAVAVLTDSFDCGNTYAPADTHQSKDTTSTHLGNDFAAVMTNVDTNTAATDDFMRRSQSSESNVVTSPSRNGDSNCSRSTVSHPPSSPETFLLITPAGGMPGTPSPTTHQHMHMYGTSPTSLIWDEEYSNMEKFFDDVTCGGTSDTSMYPSASEGGGQENGEIMCSRKEGSDNGVAEVCGDVSSENHVRVSPVKRKCNVLRDCRSPLLVEDDRKKRHVNYPKHPRAQNEENIQLTSRRSSPLSLRTVMNSLSTSSNEILDAPKMRITTSKKSKKKNMKVKTNKNQYSPLKSTMHLTPKSQPLTPSSSSCPPSPSAPHHSQPQQIQTNERGIESIEVDRYSDHTHPSIGTFEQYDNELYHKLRNTHTSRDMTLPPHLVPSTMTGNRLVILQGSSKQQTHYEIENCVLHSTHVFYQFLRGIYPALEGCTYLLPGLQQRIPNDQCSSRCEEADDGIELRSNIHVSSFGSFPLGHMPGMTPSEKV